MANLFRCGASKSAVIRKKTFDLSSATVNSSGGLEIVLKGVISDYSDLTVDNIFVEINSMQPPSGVSGVSDYIGITKTYAPSTGRLTIKGSKDIWGILAPRNKVTVYIANGIEVEAL